MVLGAYIYRMQGLGNMEDFLIVGRKAYPAGIYGYRLVVDGKNMEVKKMILQK